jgi:hypothetical protein
MHALLSAGSNGNQARFAIAADGIKFDPLSPRRLNGIARGYVPGRHRVLLMRALAPEAGAARPI